MFTGCRGIAAYGKQGSRARGSRWVAVLAGLVLVFMLVFSAFFLVEEYDHHCANHHCSVCSAIQLCENIMHHMAEGGAALGAAAISLVCIILISISGENLIPHTPVSQKVRMNN